MDRTTGNDNRMHKSLEGVLEYKYIQYTSELLYFPYVEEGKLRNPKKWEKQQLLLRKENDSW